MSSFNLNHPDKSKIPPIPEFEPEPEANRFELEPPEPEPEPEPEAEPEPKEPLIEFLSPSELAAFEPPEGWNMVGDYHLQRGSVIVFGGEPGVGKSRIATGLALAGATGENWMGLEVHTRFKTMIIQCENGRVRLAEELSDVYATGLDDWIRISPPPPRGFAFDDLGFCEALRLEVERFQPDLVVVDPWNRVAEDDKSKDYKIAFDRLMGVVPLGGEKPPCLAIIAHTRKPKSDERSSGRGLLKTLAGSYVIGSVPRCAFVLQAASDDPEDPQVVWTCCKNNDGPLGARSAWERRNGLFEPVQGFDWDKFDSRGEKTRRRIITPELLKTILKAEGELTKAELVRQLSEGHAFNKSAAYKAIDKYSSEGSIVEVNGSYTHPGDF